MKSKTAIASSDSSRFQGCLMYGFFLIFALAGSVMAVFLIIRPAMNLIDAQDWQMVSCTITGSTVEASSGSDSETYSIAIDYRYEFQGLSYTGDRYDFSIGSSSGYEGKAEVVAAYPVGLETLCFVNPDDPESSVINRSPGLYLLWGLFPLPFLLVGYGGLIAIFLGHKFVGSKSAKASRVPAVEPQPLQQHLQQPLQQHLQQDAHDPTQPLVLESTSSPRDRAIGFGVIALIWNGFAAFIAQMIYRNEGFGFALIFVSIFLLFGVLLIGKTIHQALASTNPKPKLILTPARPVLGEVCQLQWSLSGRKAEISRMTIKIEARESATYRRGTDTVTDHSTFHREILFEGRPTVLRQGSSHFTLPERSMPSFEANNNKIEWRITVHGDIPRWPDIEEKFPLTVLPPAKSGTSGGML